MYSLLLLPQDILKIIISYAITNDGLDITRLKNTCKIFRDILLEKDENGYCIMLSVYTNTRMIKDIAVKESSSMKIIAYILYLENWINLDELREYIDRNIHMKELVIDTNTIRSNEYRGTLLDEIYAICKEKSITLRGNSDIINNRNQMYDLAHCQCTTNGIICDLGVSTFCGPGDFRCIIHAKFGKVYIA